MVRVPLLGAPSGGVPHRAVLLAEVDHIGNAVLQIAAERRDERHADGILGEQAATMGRYLAILEARAEAEGIVLDKEVIL